MLNDNKAMQIFNQGDITSNREVQAAIAEIQARFMLAQMPQMKRVYEVVAANIKEVCARKGFADNAIYNVKVGSKFNKSTHQWDDVYDEDFNIRAAEQFMIHYRNVSTNVVTVHEDNEKRKVAISLTDLESNITYNDEVTLYKTVERKKLKQGQTALSERETSIAGQKVFIVACTPEELQKKQDAQVSKKIRKMFFRLFPVELKIMARETVNATILSDIKNNIKDRRVGMLESFKSFGIEPEEIEEYAGKRISKFDEESILAMAKIFNGLKEGELKWSELMASKEDIPPEAPVFDPANDMQDVPDAKKPENKETKKEKPAKQKKGAKEGKSTPADDVSGKVCEAHGEEDCETCRGEDQTITNDAQDQAEPPEGTKNEKAKPTSKTKKSEIVDRIIEKLAGIPEEEKRGLEQKAHVFNGSFEKREQLMSIVPHVLESVESLIDGWIEENLTDNG
jgi:hypothetical protein